MKLVEHFFRDLDHEWNSSQGKITLLIIGSGALFLQADYERGTKDSDILETSEISPDVSEKLRAIAGRGSPLFKKHRIFLDIDKSADSISTPNADFSRRPQLEAKEFFYPSSGHR